MITKLYMSADHKFIVCAKTNTLRLMPENYLVAKHNGGHWVLDPDLACPLQAVILVTSALMIHSVKWSSVESCKLLAAVTGDNVNKYVSDLSSTVYIDQLATVVNGGNHRQLTEA